MRCAFPMSRSSLPDLLRGLLLVLLLAPLAPAAVAEEAVPAANEPAEVMGDEVEEGERLLARAEAYWKARIAKEAKVYEYYPPEDKRPEGMRGIAAEGGGIAWTSYQIEAVKAEGEEGLVQVRTQMQLPAEQAARFPDSMKKFLAPTVMERWVLLEGEWYKRPMEMGLSRMMKAGRERAEAAREAEEAAKAAAGKPEAATE